MQEVEVKPRPVELLISLLSPERAQHFTDAAVRARAAFARRTIWHVNATAQGGGVAEMLQTLLAYGRGAGIENRWLVLDGQPDFFAITKRLHNLLHGSPGDGGPLGPGEDAVFRRVLDANLAQMLPRVSAGDIVLLHDPQTAAMVDGLRARGAVVVWRCHVGRDRPNDHTDSAWAFLRPHLAHADAVVFSRREYVPPWIEPDLVTIIPPSIDPFSAKNRALAPGAVSAILATAGLVGGADPDGPVRFECRDGSTGTVRPHQRVYAGPGRPPHDARIILQVSRWDRLKDMAGVLRAFASMAAEGPPDAHLVLAGPDVAGVTDDPEGAEVLAECREEWARLPEPVRGRAHLASIPMDDVDENAIIINALQRHAYAVVQKSLEEGFGLTVTEAMWKARPLIASAVGGIQDQIVDGREGVLLRDPGDVEAAAAAMARLLAHPGDAQRMGANGEARVREEYLGDRHLLQYAELFERVVS